MTIAVNEKHSVSPTMEDTDVQSASRPSILSSHKTRIIEGAAAATNLGVVSFWNGDLSSAMQLFREALLDVKMAFAQEESSIDGTSLNRASHRVAQANPEGSSSVSSPFDLASKSLIESLQQEYLLDSVFLHPFSIQSPIKEQHGQHFFCSDVDVDSSIFSAVIIYNMAISTHKMTQLTHPSRRKEALRQRTASLYDMCHQLLTNASEHFDQAIANPTSFLLKGIGRAMIDLIGMAIVNNKAQIYAGIIEHQLTCIHMDHLIELSSFACEQNYCDDALNAAVHSAAEFFLANATQSKLFRVSAAPAA